MSATFGPWVPSRSAKIELGGQHRAAFGGIRRNLCWVERPGAGSTKIGPGSAKFEVRQNLRPVRSSAAELSPSFRPQIGPGDQGDCAAGSDFRAGAIRRSEADILCVAAPSGGANCICTGQDFLGGTGQLKHCRRWPLRSKSLPGVVLATLATLGAQSADVGRCLRISVRCRPSSGDAGKLGCDLDQRFRGICLTFATSASRTLISIGQRISW